MKKCINCGAEMSDDDVFCMNCGTRNDAAAAESVRRPEPERYPNSVTPAVLTPKPEERSYYNSFRPPVNKAPVSSPSGAVRIDKDLIRKYFFGSSGMLSTLIIVIGVVLLFVVFFIGIPLIVLGIYMKFRADSTGEAAVDEAERYFINQLKNNYLDKINMDESEVNLIDPVTVIGFGEEPDRSLGMNDNDLSTGNGNIISRMLKSISASVTTDDPVKAYRVGTDGAIRSLLLQVTTYVFSEEQVFVYTGNVDISTGMVYDEYTNEIFYEDISDIFMEESMAKVFNKKEKKYTYYKNQLIGLKGNGFSLGSSMRANLNSDAFSEQFASMRNLIRDKKRG